MKKTRIYICSLLMLAFSVVSCNDFLDKEPISDLTGENFWKTAADAEVGTIAIYNGFMQAMANGVWDWGEIRSDNFWATAKGSEAQKDLVNNSIRIDNPANNWRYLYLTIARANDAIKNIPNIQMTPTVKNNLLAEAYAMRAWAYFYCIRTWGDVPMYTEPVKEISDGIYRERTDKNVIMNEIIIPDLERAYFLINKKYANNSVINCKRITVASICTILMDVYAWNHDYEAVVRVKEERINPITNSAGTNYWRLEPYASGIDFAENLTGWRSIFYEKPEKGFSREIIFKLAYERITNSSGASAGEHRLFNYFAGDSPKLVLSDKAMSAYKEAANDKRYGATQWSSWMSGGEYLGEKLNKKFWPDGTKFSASSGSYSDNDVILYRYADIVLMYAEALNAIDRTADAVTELNRTRTRAGVTPAYSAADFTSKEDLLDAILNERQREFLGEGKRWFDLIRTDSWREVMQPINGMNDERHLLFPIHRDHLNQNISLKQNPGY